ncbi:uncharacterized protein LOC122006490 [Zingiber officinale]|uniref:uncharacterized protein LOC122006490 n=1 Tax=Zingiber officinale TaxID=94328 RepID=UPI001C4CDE67|nr:uncharacterized protein LOC122006490 [Zingiber officinale]
MGWNRGALSLWLPPLLTWMAAASLLPEVLSQVSFLKAPPAFSPSPEAAFQFEAREGSDGGESCGSNCSFVCKLDNYTSSSCKSKKVSYSGLLDGNHMFEVCVSASRRVRCASYYWTVDTISPTAHLSAASSFTNALNMSVNVSFSEPCTGGGGFRCTPSYCSLLVYGAGYVIPSTLKVILPEQEYALVVAISADVQYGRLVLVMDRGFCKDVSGNTFKRTSNSSFIVHFDRRSVLMSLETGIPKKILQLKGEIRTAEATNIAKDLRIYLSFSEPVLNSSEELLGILHTSNGLLVPTNRSTHGNRRFGYIAQNIPSMAVITVLCDTSKIISRQGTPVSPSDPITFLYDDQRPFVKLSTTSNMRNRRHKIPVLIRFMKAVFEFNSSSLMISGGRMRSFHEITKSMYIIEIHAEDSIVSVEVPENTTVDIAGNKNLQSNILQVKHYSMPTISSLVSIVATIAVALTSMFASLLTVSTSSLISSGAISRQKSYLVSEPSRNLMRILCHIQVFALSRWLVIGMPIEYYEFSIGIEWSIPYMSLPWETGSNSLFEDPTFAFGTYSGVRERRMLETFRSPSVSPLIPEMDPLTPGKPLTAGEYFSFLENQNMKPEAEFIMISRNSDRWEYFARNMFWLAVLGGGLILLHVTILGILKLKRKISEKQKEFGALVFPRFEISLILLALPCICQASASIIRGRTMASLVVGIILLGISTSILISLILFLSLGIAMGKLLQYKEVHQEGQEFHWYQELIRVILGPGKRGLWSWKNKQDSINRMKFGPLFEDLRGPPKYMLTQISGRTGDEAKRDDQIIVSEDENEDSEAPFIEKLFGILRIYYTVVELVKRVSLGILAGAYSSSRPSRTPTLIILSITSFQLVFLASKKPFIKKKVQFTEIISVASEVGLFAACLVLHEKELSDVNEKRIGLFMLSMFIIMLTPQLINEWHALYQQVVRLRPTGGTFSSGLKRAIGGIILLVLPPSWMAQLTEQLASSQEEGDSGSTMSPRGRAQRASGASERSWPLQLRELARASFSREAAGPPYDPSSSTYQLTRFWTGKRSGSSSLTSSSDFKSKSKELYKDLEAIFSSK